MFGRNLRSKYWWRRVDEEVGSEFEFHIEMRAREYVARGMDPEAARELARQKFGNLGAVKRTCAGLALEGERSRHRLQWLEELVQDARYAVRQLRRQPLFTLIAVMTLAIGIGANTAIFSVLNTVYLRALPFRDAEQLYRISQFSVGPDGSHRRTSASGFALEAILERAPAFEEVLGQRIDSMSLDTGELPQRANVISISPRWAEMLGVTPVAGRNFSSAEYATGIDSGVTVLSHALAVQRFGSAHAAVGGSVTVGGRPLGIVGVYPAGFHYPYEAELWIPFAFTRDDRRLNITARLRLGVALAEANRQLAEVADYVASAAPAFRGTGLEAVPVRDTLIDGEARVATALMTAVGLVLLIACANLAMLLTTRYVGRRQEVAIRAALGGGRFRQVRQFVTESALVFALGAIGGVVLMLWLRGYLTTLIPEDLRRQLLLGEVAMDWRVVIFTAIVTLSTGVTFGALAALRASRVDVTEVLRDSRSTGGRVNRRTLDVLAVAEIALAIALLASAGLMAQSFQRLQRRDLGFAPDGILTLQADLTGQRYADGTRRIAYVDDSMARIAAVPGVIAASLTTDNPLCCGDWGARIIPEGLPLANDQAAPVVAHRLITPDYFRTLGIRLLRGRYFSDRDTISTHPVVIIDERMARHLWPGVDPIGRRVKRGPIDSANPWMTIVGVVSSVWVEGDYADTWYLPYAQHPLGPSSEELYVMVRAGGDPLALVPSVRAAMAAADRSVAQAEVTTMDRLWSEHIGQDRVGAIVVALFAGFGLLLAGLGVYGVMAYNVRQREAEIGVRLALGAASRRILADVMSRAVSIAAVGLALGLAGAFASGRILSTMLVDVAPQETSIVLASGGVLGLVALLAAIVPALRAVRIDPVIVLKG